MHFELSSLEMSDIRTIVKYIGYDREFAVDHFLLPIRASIQHYFNFLLWFEVLPLSIHLPDRVPYLEVL